MGDGSANERVDNFLNSQLQAPPDASPKFGQEIYQSKAGYVPPNGQRPGYEELAPGLYVPDSAMAPAVTGRGSLADQCGLHGIDAGHAVPAGGTDQTVVSPVVENRQTTEPAQPDATSNQNPVNQPAPEVTPVTQGGNKTDAPVTTPAGGQVEQPTPPQQTTTQDNRTSTNTTDSVPTNSGSQQVAPIFFKNQNASQSTGDGDPNQNGGNGQRPWRANPYEQPVAPGFFRKPDGSGMPPRDNNTTGGDQTTPRFPHTPPATPTAANNNQNTLGQQVARMKNAVDFSLDPYSGFWGNELLGGGAAIWAGGPGARWLDGASKSIIAGGEVSPAQSANLLDRLALGYQRRFGLASENHESFNPLYKKINDVGDELRKIAANEVAPEVSRLQAEVDHKTFATFTDEEKQWVADHVYVSGADPTDKWGVEPSNDLKQLGKKLHDLEAARAQHLQDNPVLANYDPVKYGQAKAIEQKYKPMLEDKLNTLSAEGEGLLNKYERAAESAFAGNPEGLEAARKYQFLKAYEADSKANPLDFHVTLTAEEQAALTDKSKLKYLIEHVEPHGKSALEAYTKAGEEALKSGDELAKLNRYKFYKAFSDNPKIDSSEFTANLGADEAWVSDYRQARFYLKDVKDGPIAYKDLLRIDRQLQEAQAEVNKIGDELKKKVAPLEEKITAARAALADDPMVRKLEYLSHGAYGEVPQGVQFTDAEKRSIDKLHALRERMNIFDPRVGLQTERDRILAPKMSAVAIDMEKDDAFKEIYKKVAARPKVIQDLNGVPTEVPVSVESVLTKDELQQWAKYQYFKKRGVDAELPQATVLSKEEAQLITRGIDLKKELDTLSTNEARSATTWRARLNSDGAKIADGHFGNLAEGLAAVATADFLADRLDNHIWGSSHRPMTHYATALAPWVGLMSGGTWVRKAAVTAALEMGGSALEHVLPVDPGSRWNSLLRPTGMDALALGIATTIPLRNESLPARLTLMGLGLGVSKVANFGSEMIFGTARSARDSGFSAANDDANNRTAGSMDNAIDRLKKLGDYDVKGKVKQPMSLLDYYLGDQLSSTPKDAVTGHRRSAIFLAAAGEARMGKGTMVPHVEGGTDSGPWLWRATKQLSRAVVASFTGPDRQFDYILAGDGIDLGGQSLTFLTAAKGEIAQSQQSTRDLLNSNPNATLNNTKVSEQEIKDLDKEAGRVCADIEQIYGKHDIHAIFKKLAEYTPALKQNVMGHLREQIIAKIQKGGIDDPRYYAKLNRDVALIDLAFASGESRGSLPSGANADIMLKDAQLRLQKARELDDKNEDLPQLELIAQQMGGMVTNAINKQGQNGIANPFGITNWR
jgi:hypothetical protein